MAVSTENPILLVHASEQDYRAPAGGGGGSAREFVDVTPEYREEITDMIHTAVADFDDSFVSWPELPCVAKLTLREIALAKSHRPHYLLDKAEAPIIGAAGFGELLLSVNKETLSSLSDQVTNCNTKMGRGNISTIQDFSAYGVDDRLGGSDGWTIQNLTGWLDAGHKLKAELFDYSLDNHDLNRTVLQQFLAFAKELKITADLQEYLISKQLFSVSTERPDLLESLLKFPALRRLAPMPTYESDMIGLQDIVGDVNPAVLSTPDPDTAYPLVGLIDSGIDPSANSLTPWVEESVSFVLPEDVDNLHGTFVGGLITNSKPLNLNHSSFPSNSAKIIDVTALSKDGANEIDLIARILDVVERYPQVNVWNLSLGGQQPGPTEYFSDFAQMLDSLADQTGCLFVVASGNYIDTPLRTMPPQAHIGDSDRISVPAETARGVTVGSIAHLAVEQSAVEVGDPSPFSRRGPGPASMVKPELTHLGGNCSVGGDSTYTSVRSFFPDNKIGEGIGTSYATPLVSLLAAQAWDEIEKSGQIVTPELVKALLIHGAVTNSPEHEGGSLNYHGFGQPGDLEELLYCSPHAATLMFEADVQDGLEFEKFPFPIPSCLRNNEGKFRGEIIVTLCYSPPLDGGFGAEYCRANVDISFGTYDVDIDGKRRQKGKVPLEPCDKSQLYEHKMVEHGFKWSPVKVYRKKFKNGVAGEDWRLKLSVLRRSGEVPPDFPQRAVVVITLRGIDGDEPVYQDTVQAMTRAGWVTNRLSPVVQVQV